jgi:hypothetical protein
MHPKKRDRQEPNPKSNKKQHPDTHSLIGLLVSEHLVELSSLSPQNPHSEPTRTIHPTEIPLKAVPEKPIAEKFHFLSVEVIDLEEPELVQSFSNAKHTFRSPTCEVIDLEDLEEPELVQSSSNTKDTFEPQNVDETTVLHHQDGDTSSPRTPPLVCERRPYDGGISGNSSPLTESMVQDDIVSPPRMSPDLERQSDILHSSSWKTPISRHNPLSIEALMNSSRKPPDEDVLSFQFPHIQEIREITVSQGRREETQNESSAKQSLEAITKITSPPPPLRFEDIFEKAVISQMQEIDEVKLGFVRPLQEVDTSSKTIVKNRKTILQYKAKISCNVEFFISTPGNIKRRCPSCARHTRCVAWSLCIWKVPGCFTISQRHGRT